MKRGLKRMGRSTLKGLKTLGKFGLRKGVEILRRRQRRRARRRRRRRRKRMRRRRRRQRERKQGILVNNKGITPIPKPSEFAQAPKVPKPNPLAQTFPIKLPPKRDSRGGGGNAML